jgi:hypothetical protein
MGHVLYYGNNGRCKRFILESIYWLVFIFAGYLSFDIFYFYSPDLHEYHRLIFEVDGNYFEPFWVIVSIVARQVISDDLLSVAHLLFIIYYLLFYLCLRAARNQGLNFSSLYLFFFIVLSITLGGVLGAYRQTIAMMFVLYILLYSNKINLIYLSIFMHWSLAPVLLIYSLNKYRKTMIPIVITASLAWIIIYNSSVIDSDFIEISFVDRVGYYLMNNDFSSAYSLIQFFQMILLKVYLFGVFYLAKSDLLRICRFKELVPYVIMAPLFQLGLVVVTDNTLLVQRVGLLFEPLIIVGIYCLISNNYFKKYGVLLLIPFLFKFLSFLFSVLN